MQPGNKPSLDAAARAYTTLFNKYKDALFVAAAGASTTLSGQQPRQLGGPGLLMPRPAAI